MDLNLPVAAELSEVERPFRWVWDDYLATGMVTLFNGRWKAGKTTLLSVLLAKLGPGGALAGSAVAPTETVVVSEEPAALWAERHARLSFGPHVRFACRPFPDRPAREEWRTFATALAARRPGLVVFDPLSMFLPGHVENHATLYQDALRPLHRLTDAGAAVLLLHHPRRGVGVDEFTGRGSGSQNGFVDILVGLEKLDGGDRHDRRRRLTTSARRSPTTSKVIELAADGLDYAVRAEELREDGFEAAWPLLLAVLEDTDNRLSRRHILTRWPEDFERPSHRSLARWLMRAVAEKGIVVQGTGRSGDPFLYALPGRKFRLDDPEFHLPPPPHLFGPPKVRKPLLDVFRQGLE